MKCCHVASAAPVQVTIVHCRSDPGTAERLFWQQGRRDATEEGRGWQQINLKLCGWTILPESNRGGGGDKRGNEKDLQLVDYSVVVEYNGGHRSTRNCTLIWCSAIEMRHCQVPFCCYDLLNPQQAVQSPQPATSPLSLLHGELITRAKGNVH